MKIGALQKTTLLDFPGKLACIVFTQGCNLRCGYCYNNVLWDFNAPGAVPEKEVIDFLKTRINKLEGVVITGGEPTMQKGLKKFIKKIRALGFKIKLDTNGTGPKVLKELLEEKLLDYVAMDVKGPLSKYKQITGTDALNKQIKESISLIRESGVDYEFRTVKLDILTDEDFKEIKSLIGKNSKHYTNDFLSPDMI